MTLFYPIIEEYLFTQEHIQGNVNIAGLVFENDIEELLYLEAEGYTVYIDQIEDGFSLVDEHTRNHGPYCIIDDGFHFEPIKLGEPMRVKQSVVNVVHSMPVAPVDCCFLQLDIIHGMDSFYEELSEALHFNDFDSAAFRYTFHCYESFDLVMENVPDNKIYACWKELNMGVSDLVNMRHEVVQEYYFNNLAKDRLFVYDKQTWGWQHDIGENFYLTSHASKILGIVLKGHLFFQTKLDEAWAGKEILQDRIFAWDIATQKRGWNLPIDEDLTLDEAVSVYLDLMATEVLGFVELIQGKKYLSYIANDKLKLAERLVNAFEITINDNLQGIDQTWDSSRDLMLLDEQAGFTESVQSARIFNEHIDNILDFSETMN